MTSRNADLHEVGIASSLLVPLKWCFYVAFLLGGLLLAAWIVDGILVFRVWPQGLDELRRIVGQDLAHANSLGGWNHQLASWAVGSANLLYDMIFKVTGIHSMATHFADPAPMSVTNSLVRKIYMANFPEFQMAMLSTQLLGVRFAMLAAAAPMIVLLYAVGMADGLAWRGIRRARGGHESSTIYHRAKYLSVMLGALLGAAYLLMPISLDVRYSLLPWVIVLAALTRWQWGYYKKYL